MQRLIEMNRASRNYFSISLVLIIITALTARIYSLNRTNFKIDDLKTQLAPFSKYLKPYNKIGFVDSTTSAIPFMEVEYLWLPRTIVNNLSADTLLLVQNRANKVTLPANYKLIERRDYNNKAFLFAIKTK